MRLVLDTVIEPQELKGDFFKTRISNYEFVDGYDKVIEFRKSEELSLLAIL